MLTVTYYGKLADLTGKPAETLALRPSVADTHALRRLLDARYGAEGVLLDPRVRIAINDVIVTEPFAIAAGDAIAFLPIVGGG